MRDLIGLIMVVGLWAFAVGCGDSSAKVETTPPTAAEVEENEEMGALPSE